MFCSICRIIFDFSSHTIKYIEYQTIQPICIFFHSLFILSILCHPNLSFITYKITFQYEIFNIFMYSNILVHHIISNNYYFSFKVRHNNKFKNLYIFVCTNMYYLYVFIMLMSNSCIVIKIFGSLLYC